MNCPCPEFDLEKYKGKPYQETPCATCFMTRQTNNTNKHSKLFDQDGAIDEVVDETTEQPPEELDAKDLAKEEITPEAVDLIMEACEQNFFLVLSNVVLKLTDMAKSYPALYQILHLKMQYPNLSYYKIGQKMVPPCSKQNVLYHLLHAVNEIPELHKAILTDTRFSGGHYAIRTEAAKNARQKQVEKVRRKLYDTSELNSRKEFKELVRIFTKPYKVDIISDFDSYGESDSDKNRS